MEAVFKRIYLAGLVPVISIEDAQQALPLAKALMAGGLDIAEVSFRTTAAAEAIRRIRNEFPEMLISAGTVITEQQMQQAQSAGANFVVTPGFNPVQVRRAVEQNIPIVPGTATPGEMEQAMALGLNVVKFFPAEQNGGLDKLKAFAGPYRNLRYMPTGGINTQNLPAYIRFNQTLACGGSWMVKPELISAGAWDEITRLTKEAVDVMLGFELKHVGINPYSGQSATQTAAIFERAFGFGWEEGTKSVFCGGRTFELMKTIGSGGMGHIAIGTNSLDRAVHHLKHRGFEVDETTRVDKNGTTIAIYLKQEISGFAFHLMQK